MENNKSFIKETFSKKVAQFLAILTFLVMTLSVNATDTNGPLKSIGAPINYVADYLAANTNAVHATNWTGFVAYSRVSGGAGSSGGTFGAVYYVNPYVGTQIRFQYINTGKSKWVLPNGTVTLQSAYQPFGSGIPITLRPMLEAGAATDLSGNIYAIIGVGSELDLFTSKSDTTIKRISIFYGREKWQGFGKSLGVTQYGVAVNLDAGKIISKVDEWLTSAIGKL